MQKEPFSRQNLLLIGAFSWIITFLILAFNLLLDHQNEISLGLFVLYCVLIFNFLFPFYIFILFLRKYHSSQDIPEINLFQVAVESFLLFFIYLSVISVFFSIFAPIEVFFLCEAINFVLIACVIYFESTKSIKQEWTLDVRSRSFFLPIAIGIVAMVLYLPSYLIHFPLKVGDSWVHTRIVNSFMLDNSSLREGIPISYDFYFHYFIHSLTRFLLTTPEATLFFSITLHIFQIISFVNFILYFTKNLPARTAKWIASFSVALIYFSSICGPIYWTMVLLFPEIVSLLPSNALLLESIATIMAWHVNPKTGLLPKSVALTATFYWLTLLKKELEDEGKTFRARTVITAFLSAFVFSIHFLEAVLIIIPLSILFPIMKATLDNPSGQFSRTQAVVIQLLPIPLFLMLDFLSGSPIRHGSHLVFSLSFLKILPIPVLYNILIFWVILALSLTSISLYLSRAFVIAKAALNKKESYSRYFSQRALLATYSAFLLFFGVVAGLLALTTESPLYQQNLILLLFFSLFPMLFMLAFGFSLIKRIPASSKLIIGFLLAPFPLIMFFWPFQSTIPSNILPRLLEIWFYFVAFIASFGLVTILNSAFSYKAKLKPSLVVLERALRFGLILFLVAIVISNASFSLLLEASDSDRAISSEDRDLLDWIEQQPQEINYIILDPYLASLIWSFTSLSVEKHEPVVISSLYSTLSEEMLFGWFLHERKQAMQNIVIYNENYAREFGGILPEFFMENDILFRANELVVTSIDSMFEAVCPITFIHTQFLSSNQTRIRKLQEIWKFVPDFMATRALFGKDLLSEMPANLLDGRFGDFLDEGLGSSFFVTDVDELVMMMLMFELDTNETLSISKKAISKIQFGNIEVALKVPTPTNIVETTSNISNVQITSFGEYFSDIGETGALAALFQHEKGNLLYWPSFYEMTSDDVLFANLTENLLKTATANFTDDWQEVLEAGIHISPTFFYDEFGMSYANGFSCDNAILNGELYLIGNRNDSIGIEFPFGDTELEGFLGDVNRVWKNVSGEIQKESSLAIRLSKSIQVNISRFYNVTDWRFIHNRTLEIPKDSVIHLEGIRIQVNGTTSFSDVTKTMELRRGDWDIRSNITRIYSGKIVFEVVEPRSIFVWGTEWTEAQISDISVPIVTLAEVQDVARKNLLASVFRLLLILIGFLTMTQLIFMFITSSRRRLLRRRA
ncbi:MAG: hypothetical protein ACE5OZ_02730 [Candidatus Heimdallarchaeota archaeon]